MLINEKNVHLWQTGLFSGLVGMASGYALGSNTSRKTLDMYKKWYDEDKEAKEYLRHEIKERDEIVHQLENTMNEYEPVMEEAQRRAKAYMQENERLRKNRGTYIEEDPDYAEYAS